MPRLNNTNFLKAHHWLRQLWLEDIGNYAQLYPPDQTELHLFFCPSKDWSDDKLIEHRQIMSKADPSLPQRAGRALKRFELVRAGELAYLPPVHVTPAKGRQRGHNISVRVVMRPEPDLQRLARALLQLTPEQIAKLKRGEGLRED
jgi:hypothetical protein